MISISKNRWMQLAGILKENSSDFQEDEKDEYQSEYDNLENLANWYKELFAQYRTWNKAFPTEEQNWNVF